VYPETTLRALTQALLESKNDCLAVVSRRDELLGAVHAHDILRRILPFQHVLAGQLRPARAA
jgi:hypothetical protein